MGEWMGREEEGKQREKSGRTDAVDDRTTFVYPPAKPLPEFIIICSTTVAPYVGYVPEVHVPFDIR